MLRRWFWDGAIDVAPIVGGVLIGIATMPLRAADLPSPEAAAIQNLSQQLAAANNKAAMAEASLAASIAKQAQVDDYWKRYVAPAPAELPKPTKPPND